MTADPSTISNPNDMSETEFHPCPICSTPVPHWARYPKSVCHNCFDKACDDQGRKLGFYNVSFSGGFKAVVVETGEENENHICYIEGVKCWADEHRFGGIVIQPFES